MMVNLRLPKLDAPTPQGQIKQLNSYLFQTVGELQATLDTMEQKIKELEGEVKRLTQE